MSEINSNRPVLHLPPKGDLVTLGEVCRRLRKSEDEVLRREADHTMPAMYDGHVSTWKRADIEGYLQACEWARQGVHHYTVAVGGDKEAK